MSGRPRTTAMVMASCLIASSALADPRPKVVSDKDKQVAGDLVKKAIARSQAGDHSAAIDIYLQAYTIVPNSILLSNIGSEYQQSGKQKEALRYFCMYLEQDPNGTNAVYATTQARSLQILLGNKHVDDDDVCAPAEAEPTAKDPRKRKPRDPEDEERPRDRDRSEPADAPLPEAPPSRGDSTQRIAGLALGGVGVVALGVSVYAGIQAKNISDEISSHPAGVPWENGIQAEQRRGQNYEYLQIGSLIAGGALVITGVVLYLRSGGSSDAHDAAKAADKAAVRVAPTGHGLAVLGRF